MTDPPTSGPHAPGPPIGGVLTSPLARPSQVGALEAGGVLLQYRDLTPDERTSLESLASANVAVAPNSSLPTRVVATAWVRKQSCTGVDIPALRSFIDANLDHGPEGP